MSGSIKQDDVPVSGSSERVESAAAAASAGNLRVLTILMAIIVCAVMVGDVQGVALNPLVATISQKLGLTGSQVGWILNGYTLAGAAFSGILSRLGDAVGSKRVLLPVLAAATAGAVTCALAESLEFLILGRVLMGLAIPAVALVWGLVRPRATAKQNQKMTFAIGTAAAIGVPVALVSGGLFVTTGVPWQTLFWITAGFMVLAFALVFAVPESPTVQRVRIPLDALGGIGLGIWLTFLLLTLSYGPADGWTSSHVVTFAAIATVVFTAWVVQQVKNPHRLMAFRRDDLRQMLSGYTAAWFGANVAPTLMFIFLPALLQTPSSTGYGLGLSVFESTLPLVMMAPVGVVLQFILGPLIGKFGPRAMLCAGSAFCAVGFLGLGLAASSFLIVFVWFTIYAFGAMILMMAGFSLTTAAGRQDNISVTFGLQYAGGFMFISVAATLALSIFVPDAQGFLPHSVFLTGFIGAAVTALACSIGWLFLVPRKFVDKHAAIALVH